MFIRILHNRAEIGVVKIYLFVIAHDNVDADKLRARFDNVNSLNKTFFRDKKNGSAANRPDFY